ncbi:unnamed protein product [Protopolystoma xenopodis]|uniref:Uncharacterized protein n=1 Tax=Protopolystoma xenopodis TaxID=117903 RepID=A0A3S5FBS5_9PLAT|nr:unnamed protein product [Protopolystoma xenopodis]
MALAHGMYMPSQLPANSPFLFEKQGGTGGRYYLASLFSIIRFYHVDLILIKHLEISLLYSSSLYVPNSHIPMLLDSQTKTLNFNCLQKVNLTLAFIAALASLDLLSSFTLCPDQWISQILSSFSVKRVETLF